MAREMTYGAYGEADKCEMLQIEKSNVRGNTINDKTLNGNDEESKEKELRRHLHIPAF